MRSRSDTCAAAPATGSAGARGLRVSEKPRTTLQSVIHRLSRPSASDVLAVGTACPQLFHKVLALVGTCPWPPPDMSRIRGTRTRPVRAHPFFHRRDAKETPK